MKLETLPAVIAGVCGASAFLGALVGLPLPAGLVGLATSILVGGGTATGVYLVLPRTEDRPREEPINDELKDIATVPGIDPQEVLDAVKLGRSKVQRTSTVAYELSDFALIERVQRICGISNRIINNFKTDPRDVKAARTWLNQYLDQFHNIVDGYVRLSAGLKLVSPKSREEFVETLDVIEESFLKFEAKLLANDFDALEVDMQVLRSMLKQDGH